MLHHSQPYNAVFAASPQYSVAICILVMMTVWLIAVQ